MALMHLEFYLPDSFQFCKIFIEFIRHFFTSKISILLTVILVGRVEDFMVHFPSISIPCFLASPSNFYEELFL